MSQEASAGPRPTSLLPPEDPRRLMSLSSPAPQETLERSSGTDGLSQENGYRVRSSRKSRDSRSSSSLRLVRDEKLSEHYVRPWKNTGTRCYNHSSGDTDKEDPGGESRVGNAELKAQLRINSKSQGDHKSELQSGVRKTTRFAQFPYYDTESESEEVHGRLAEKCKAKGDWLEEQKKEFNNQQRRFQALVDRLRLREGEFHVAPSVRNNILTKLQQSLPSPASLTFSSPTDGADVSCSSRSSSPPPPLDLSRSDDDVADPAWTEASILVRQLQHVYEQRDQLEKWADEQRRLQKELVSAQAEQERQKEKREWQVQVTKQLTASREAQKLLEESCVQAGKREGGEGGRNPVQKHLKQLLEEKPPESISHLIQAAQHHGDDIYCVTEPALEKTPEERGEKGKGRRASMSAVVKCRPGFTLHVRSIQLCWSIRDQRAPGEKTQESGDESGIRQASEAERFSDSSFADPSSQEGRRGRSQRGGHRKEESSKTRFSPPSGLPSEAVSYCVVAGYGGGEGGDRGGFMSDDELPMYTTAWYGASVVAIDGLGTHTGSRTHREESREKSKNNLQGTTPKERDRVSPEESKQQDRFSYERDKDLEEEAKVSREREEDNEEDLTRGRSRARLAEAFLGKSLRDKSHPGVDELLKGETESGSRAREGLAAPRAPAVTLVKEACVMDTDITLPQLTPFQASRANSSCIVLHIWRHEKKIRHQMEDASRDEERTSRGRHRETATKPRKHADKKKKRGHRKKSDSEEDIRYTYIREEVGRVVVDLDDPRVYDRTQSIFTVTPLLVGLSPLGHRELVAQAVLERHLAITQGVSGVQGGMPPPAVRVSLGGKAREKRSIPARAFAASGTLYAFVLRTVSRPEAPPAVGSSSEKQDREPGDDKAKGENNSKPYKPLQWKYVDDFKVLQGPFPSHQMLEWIREGYFEEDAPVCLEDEPNRLQPLKVILSRLREDTAAYRRHQAAVTARKEEQKEKEGGEGHAPGSGRQSSRPSPRGERKPGDHFSSTAGGKSPRGDKNHGKTTDEKSRNDPSSLAALSGASSTRRTAGLTLTTTADSLCTSMATSPTKKQTSAATSPTAGEPNARTEEPLKKIKGAEVENVMKLLQEATNCLSRISSHRMSSYLQCTVGQREAGMFSVRASHDLGGYGSEENECVRNGERPSGAAERLPPAPLLAPETVGPFFEPQRAGRVRSAASQRRSAYIRERMLALEEMFGTAAVEEACAVYIQAAVRGWLQRLRFRRFLQSRRLSLSPHRRTACWHYPSPLPSGYVAAGQGGRPGNYLTFSAHSGQESVSTDAHSAGQLRVPDIHDFRRKAASGHDPRGSPTLYSYPLINACSTGAPLGYSNAAELAKPLAQLHAAAGPLPVSPNSVYANITPRVVAEAYSASSLGYSCPSAGTGCSPFYPAVSHMETAAAPHLRSPSCSSGTGRPSVRFGQPLGVGVAASPSAELMPHGQVASPGPGDPVVEFGGRSIPGGGPYLSYLQMAAERGLAPPTMFPAQHF